MSVEMETRAEQVEHGWRDKDGFVGPFQPGNGPRSDPKSGTFPTGPAVGEKLPDIRCQSASGDEIDLHARSGRQPRCGHILSIRGLVTPLPFAARGAAKCNDRFRRGRRARLRPEL